MLYSKSTGGFYDEAIHGAAIPQDMVQITRAEHAALLTAQAAGKVITADAAGHPVAIDPPTPIQAQSLIRQIRQIEAQMTPRRLREAILGIDNGWFKALDASIAALRVQLPKE